MGVIIIREMVGTSPRSWSDAARQAVATAWRAASLHDRGLVPTISRMMMTPTDPPPVEHRLHRPSVHDDTRPARFRTGLVAAQGIRRWWSLDGRRRLRERPGPNLVEAGTAVDGPVVPWREWHDGLAPAGPADRGMELPRAVRRAGALRDRSAGRAALGVVGQPLAGKEGLLARGEAELLRAVATGQTPVLVHPLQSLPRLWDALMGRGPFAEWAAGRRRARKGWGAPGRPGLVARNS